MAYTTQDDIIKRRIPEDDLIQLTDDNDLGGVDAAVVASVISEADELIDGYLRQRYDLPLASVPGFIAGIAIDLCAYSLYQRQPHVETPESIIAGRRDALALLKQIQRGDLDLGLSSSGDTTSGSGASFSANDRLTGRSKMSGLL
ncbi:DUF1320 domain-containing protein [uncultured Desulfuromusa sp.]|uniref:gp436 family protein n=1 Tax=uncultured Desulfuromusa sp. TaxID=219183 RepID=UPI002AA8A3A6|nr:DUF1320 domain-containing protein [uncultured Desulfuromusa sp.]